MPLTIGDEILRLADMSESEFMLEIAILLFSKERLTLGRASSLAGVSQVEFQRELGKRQIAVHYDVPEFEKDVASLREVGLL
jgi:predicted HTH domain antitoxin